ncbi:MAG: DUF3833 domain-containing protein [Ottowia sp.]|jgi:hypothetical protein|nr:DUF3833 domain-containing protein [Alicycliphilus sp.]MCA0442384.1 DUF3833 domain-containing protein [Pseudomonadota bacterium]MCB2033711.1 DUF3833 domain-containing protein [Ottowia sp.]MCB2035397.1 DUF3833 domain-containing protein [Ottowia sp.]MCB2068139.1 DUF3833 domain-containing protein [Ottowia sp.]
MNTRRHVLLALLAGSAVLAGCASPQVSDYAQQRPKLELDRYFNGRIRAHGIFQKRGGEVVRRFTVVMDCHWEGNQGVLDEAFSYSDGSTQRRVWRLTKHADGRYTGRADDVVGEAEGQESGNAFRWNYTLRLPVDGKEYDVQFDDWMFLVDERVMLNRATMSKFGITLGEVLLSFTKD